MTMEENEDMLVPADWESTGAIIKVIGIGGGGNNAVNNMFRTGIEGVHFVACNTDAQALRVSPLDTKIQLGAQGLGAGCNPDEGKQAAIESMGKIQEVLDNNTQMVFLTAGMGGGTGTGATPVIAKAAKEKGILTVAIVTMPFSDEGLDFTTRAREGVLELQKYVDSLLMINNDRLYEVHGELPLKQAFAKADEVLTTAVKGIAEIITRSGYINVDFADVRRAMENSNVAVMGSGAASGEGRALQAAKEALSSPLLNYNDISGAKSILINIMASDDTLMAGELREAMAYIQQCTGGMAKFVKRGVVYDNTLGNTMHITIVATGFRMQPFVENKEQVIILDDDAPSEKEPVPAGDAERKQWANRGDSGIEVVNDRRVFEEGSPAPAPVTKMKRKPVLIDENSNIDELEKIPAYLRRKVTINAPDDNYNASTSTLSATSTGVHHLSSDNSYLHQHLD
ncbi:MAG: cell division protein FtsZ [Prevotellaceae bacterium]|jgi:cell division protein FtsZ|nr:cell division protein FtsZ [Prevotellaceae bacterium]